MAADCIRSSNRHQIDLPPRSGSALLADLHLASKKPISAWGLTKRGVDYGSTGPEKSTFSRVLASDPFSQSL
jgi:hypothetical protein